MTKKISSDNKATDDTNTLSVNADASIHKGLVKYLLALKLNDAVTSNRANCVAASNMLGEIDSDIHSWRDLQNYSHQMSSCSQTSVSLWVQHLTDVFSSPEMVCLNVPLSGRAGAAEDVINMRGYFSRTLKNTKLERITQRGRTADDG